MKAFNWKLAQVTLLKTFVVSFFTPLAGVQIVINPEFIQSVYVGVISSGIMSGFVLGQVLDRYIQFLREQHR